MRKTTPKKQDSEIIIRWDRDTEEAVLRLEARIISLQWIASCSIGISALTVLFVGLHK